MDAVEVSPTRLDALRTIGQLASDKISKLGKQVELTRIKQMVENAPVNMMYADLDLKIQYMNPRARQTLKKLEAHLPMKVDQMIGQTIDIFHKQPEHQRRLLADPRNLPRTGDDQRRPRVLRAVGQRDGRSERPLHRPDDHLGGRDREARGEGPRGGAGRQHHGGQPVAPGPGPDADGPRRDHLGPGRGPRGVRLVLRVVLGGQPRGAGPAVRARLGLGQRGLPPGHGRGPVPRGRGAQRPGLADPRPGLRARPGRDEDLLPRPGRPAEPG